MSDPKEQPENSAEETKAAAESTANEPTETPGQEDSVNAPKAPASAEETASDLAAEASEQVADESEATEDDAAEEDLVDYSDLSASEMVSTFEELLKSGKVSNIKAKVDALKQAFNAQFQEAFEKQKEAFVAEGGNIVDFHYSTPEKKAFSTLLFNYKEKLNNHYKNLKKDLQANLDKRLELIEELKGLLAVDENINSTYKHFKDIQERWREAGPIQRDKYNTVWNTYHHHVENFYDFLHLNREFRDMDFKHNLDQKLKIITRAEELAQEVDVSKAFRELQMLHKVWKEELGPVAKQYRDEVWEKFSAATKVIHDKRMNAQQEMEKSYETNYLQKQEVINSIKETTSQVKPTHQGWQQAIKKVQDLRNLFFEIGKVPRSKNQEIWDAFKASTRDFNKSKNDFYKNQKKQQYTNLEKKMELIATAEKYKDAEDFEEATPIMKRIQTEWKQIGHVPRKDSDRIWSEFKAACNHYFDRLHAQRNAANKEEVEAFEKKKALLDTLTGFKASKDAAADVDNLKSLLESWKSAGRVPFNKKNIESKFQKALDQAFGSLNMDKVEAEMIKYEAKLESLKANNDPRKLTNERIYVSKKIDEVVQEINQLENNLGFFQNSDASNPLFKEVQDNIERHKETLEVWRAKLSKLKALN
ncbi:DUF349 domain-containing protein [Gilvibacter sediminis]|uniref:DUF349 domain-containing protein n=1 Tax=Gilvibacter sediminis TaxID=379071 RepID=UPI0023500296|nr:DUF349 domain-containing protein [Gilvibacter sediminis]MDC7998880.1 DUF349 domain-containing protein [Gilvibacter sediminis]